MKESTKTGSMKLKLLLINKIDDTYNKNNNDVYNLQFNKIPDPQYLRSKSEVMADAELLKQKMKKSNISNKADEIVK